MNTNSNASSVLLAEVRPRRQDTVGVDTTHALTLQSSLGATVEDLLARHTGTRADLRKFSQLCCQVHDGVASAGKWQSFLGDLALLLGATSAVLSLHDACERQVLHRFDAHAPADSSFNGFLSSDLCNPSVDGQVISTSNLRFFFLGVDLYQDGVVCARLRAARPRSSGDFSGEGREIVQLLVPHLRSAVAARTVLEEASLELAHFASAMDKLAMGALIVNRSGRVLYASPLAISILRRHDGAALVDDRLEFRDRDDSRRVKHMIERCQRDLGEVAAARIYGRSGASDMRLIARQLDTSGLDHKGRLTGTIAIFMSADPPETEANGVPVELIQRLFGFTPKEAELALKLAGGLSLQEASQALCVKPNTARAHLRSIFSKTGIDRQAKLVRVLLRSVAMLGT